MKIELNFTHKNLYVSISKCFLTDFKDKLFTKLVSWSANIVRHKSIPLYPAGTRGCLLKSELNRLFRTKMPLVTLK